MEFGDGEWHVAGGGPTDVVLHGTPILGVADIGAGAIVDVPVNFTDGGGAGINAGVLKKVVVVGLVA